MKRLFLSIVTFVTILFFSASCYYDNEEALYPSLNSSCDTANVTYTGKIVLIMSNSCISCHLTATPDNYNIRLTTYSDVKANAAAIAGSIKQTGTYKPMPKNGGKINACSITIFDIWIKNGTPN